MLRIHVDELACRGSLQISCVETLKTIDPSHLEHGTRNTGRRNGIANRKSSGQNIPKVTDRPRRNNYHPWHDSELALNSIRANSMVMTVGDQRLGPLSRPMDDALTGTLKGKRLMR
ncbi:hypothetical protein PAAG_04065 [Paracoccidioides lutzii Pb01]|uniref:Uncharacterized protein n=1 Tax=Paracoccidioides lutzii (strain ATCC MYA-826 / Pb01) TaxID=502779 RepID=C1GZX1_PARBA|nr:hypothetical protein PAAG_04065 [Paracoccidioides lutzii Pb01]EEH33012.2 hypothetical protein PAAG_04065 [Paracoccidioides lutzii Pb01]